MLFNFSRPPSKFIPTTLDPAKKGAACALSGSNLIATMTGGAGGIVLSVRGYSAGKRYFEFTRGASGAATPFGGFGNASMALTTSTVGDDNNSWGFNGFTGDTRHGGATTAYGSVWYSGAHTMGVAVDLGAGKAWLSIDNTFQNSGNPAAGTNPGFTGLVGTLFAILAGNDTTPLTVRFNPASMSFSPPSGFTAGW